MSDQEQNPVAPPSVQHTPGAQGDTYQSPNDPSTESNLQTDQPDEEVKVEDPNLGNDEVGDSAPSELESLAKDSPDSPDEVDQKPEDVNE